jgi:hypothetical protein
MHSTPGFPTSKFQERRYRRFDLQFPVSLSFAAGESTRELDAVSENVSVGGLLLRASDQVPLQTQVSLVLKVITPSTKRLVQLKGEGKVVRIEPLGDTPGFALAVECKKPICEMEDAFSAAG